MNLSIVSLLGLLLGLAGSTQAQIVQKWAVVENDVVVSWSWPDLDGDGVRELIQEDGTGCWFFDGADAYTLVWTVEDPAPTASTTFQLWLQRDGWCVFRQQNATDQQARLFIYQNGAAAPAWSTALLPGNITEGGIGDFDGDGQLELAWSWHSWNGSTWTSTWTVRRLATGAVVLAEQTGAGYLSGPWTGNIEGDASEEILLNWYWSTGLAQLVCWGANPATLDPGLLPRSSALSAWPNPFNPACRIRLDLGPLPEALTIHNLAGEQVRRLPLGGAGPLELIWDGLDQRGRPAPSGPYVVRAGGHSLPVTLIR
ncbi:MAG: hypothetical protein Q8O14_07450 [bacterium]|jgi:hypothetical protein|nr:hypothetical protein [bacterium]